MRFVLFSDLHLDAPFAWMDGARKRGEAQREALRRIARLARERDADALLCGGDLYEQEYFTPDTAEFLRRTFAELDPIRVFLAPGNHDWDSDRSLYARVAWSPNVHVFTEARLVPVPLSDSITLWGAAHRAPANTDGFLEGFHVEGPGIHLALLHGSERGWFTEQEEGKVPHAPFEERQIAEAGLHHAFLGHYHRPKDAARHTYPGNPEPLTFGEDGERGAVIATVLEDGRVERERVRVAVTEVHDLELDVTGCGDRAAVRERVARALDGLEGVARLRVAGELPESVDLTVRDLDDVPHALDALRVEFRGLRVAYDLERVAREPTVLGEFVRDVLEADDLSDDERRRILVTGLRALDGRSDLEVA